MSEQNDMDRRAEWRDRKVKAAKEKARVHAGQTIKLAQDAEGLTGLPEWDWLVRHIGQKVQDGKTLLNDTLRAFTSKRNLEAGELTNLREQALVIEAQLQVYLYIGSLPADMVKRGLDARKSLKEQEKSS